MDLNDNHQRDGARLLTRIPQQLGGLERRPESGTLLPERPMSHRRAPNVGGAQEVEEEFGNVTV